MRNEKEIKKNPMFLYVDYRISFFGGALMSVISLFAVQFIRFSARNN